MTHGKKKAIILQWVEDYTEDLLNWVYQKTSNQVLAEDLTQDTFLAAFQQIDRFRKDSSPKTWLFAILKHKIIDYYRGQFKNPIKGRIEHVRIEGFHPFNADEKWISHNAPVDWESNDQYLLNNPDFLKILGYCMDSLPTKWRAALELKYFTVKKGVDISQELGITASNYWQVIHRAKLQLRNCLETNWFKKRKDNEDDKQHVFFLS